MMIYSAEDDAPFRDIQQAGGRNPVANLGVTMLGSMVRIALVIGQVLLQGFGGRA